MAGVSSNEVRIRHIATGMAALDKAIGDRNVLLDASRLAAATVIDRTPLRSLRPDLFTAAEARAGREVLQHIKAGDTEAAAMAYRKQLFNAQAAKRALEVRNEVKGAEDLFDKIIRSNDELLGKRRNLDIVNGARAVLAAYGYSSSRNNPVAYLETLKENDPVAYADLAPAIAAALSDAPATGEARDITAGQFTAMADTVRQLWQSALRSRQIEREGKLVDIDHVVDELLSDMPEEPGPYAGLGKTHAVSQVETTALKLQGALALLRRVEDWTLLKGKNFYRNLFRPISDASLRMRQLSFKYRTQLREMLRPIEGDFSKARIAAPELGYTFGAGTTGGGLQN